MIWYVITDSEENYKKSSSFYHHKLLFEQMAGDCCLILHYKQVNEKLFSDHRPWVVCHSGGSAMYDDYDVLQNEEYHLFITQKDVPQIGFCGGHQIISTKFGSKIGPIRKLRDDDPDHNPGYNPDLYKEWGVYPVRIVKQDPIFEGLPNVIRVQEYHCWEVKELSDDLILLASSDNCKVQAFVHKGKPIYGTQFHPEQSTDRYPHGFKVLQNFFNLAKKYREI
ncbi:MAG: glutamine amidotransferase-related protein [Candidatus Poribacteria bacterium]